MGYRAKPNKGDKYKQGLYNLENPLKYLGDPTCINFRSSWEFAFYRYLDTNERVLAWNAEGITITYEVKEHDHWVTKRYYPDCYVKLRMSDGRIEECVYEIKPYIETQPPKEPKKFTLKANENYEYRMKTFLKNLTKWKKAKEYCERRGIHFYVLTEKWFEENNARKLF